MGSAVFTLSIHRVIDQLDGVRSFRDGIRDYTDAVREARDGSDEILEGVEELEEAADELIIMIRFTWRRSMILS